MPAYTEPSDLTTLDAPTLAGELRHAIIHALPTLAQLSEELASQPRKAGGWSSKQILGHLVDSAANNLQRVVRLQIEPDLRLPGYAQAEWVAVQRYDLRPWTEVLDTWRVFNLHLAAAIEQVQPEHLGRLWHFADSEITLGFIIEDYIAHLRHHLAQLPAAG